MNYIIKTRENFYENINKTFQYTYLLLSITILFSALTAIISIKNNFQGINIFLYFIAIITLLFLLNASKNNTFFGIILTFIFTGFLGYMTGPVINAHLSMKNGKEAIVLSLIFSGTIFLILSLYSVISKKNFNLLENFLFTASIIIFLCIIINIFIKIKILSLTIFGLIAISSTFFILFELSRIINGGENNYILATISLYIQIYNLFMSLINIVLYFINMKDD